MGKAALFYCGTPWAFHVTILIRTDIIYTASKVKHRLNMFLEKKTVKFFKKEIILVTFMKIDKVMTIYHKFGLDYHQCNQPGMVNAHYP